MRQFALLDYNQWQYSRTLTRWYIARQDMQTPSSRPLQDLKDERCPRCLQPVPPKAARCPGCRQPIHSLRLLPFAIGVAGLLALVFAVILMYRMVSSEGCGQAPAPVDEIPRRPAGTLPDPPAGQQPSQPNRPSPKSRRPSTSAELSQLTHPARARAFPSPQSSRIGG